ncbi:hypothetical protein ACQKE0_01520 [Shewanella colwelliana]|uniref:hypothetical protein n=1 Tax=Shewanella colwelliana TaxID=23 RepID=UPI003CFF893D
MGKQEKSHNTDSFDNWLIWLKRVAYLGITVFLSVLISYFLNFAQWPWRLSPLPQDWSAFGSLLAGAASFLAAIGTVGVLLISIRQFKVQQTQIEEQTKRQDQFEERQQQKWDKENEMLSFQKYQMHHSHFEQTLDKIENEYSIKFIHKSDLYRQTFVNNNFSQTVFTVASGSWLTRLDLVTQELLKACKSYSSSSNADGMHSILLAINRMEAILKIEFGDITDKPTPLNTFETSKLKTMLEVGLFSLNTLAELSFYDKYSAHENPYLINIAIQDIEYINGKNFTNKYNDFFEFLVLLYAAIKNDTFQHFKLFNITNKTFTFEELEAIHSLPLENSGLEHFKEMILAENLNLTEQFILLHKLDQCQKQVLDATLQSVSEEG